MVHEEVPGEVAVVPPAALAGAGGISVAAARGASAVTAATAATAVTAVPSDARGAAASRPRLKAARSFFLVAVRPRFSSRPSAMHDDGRLRYIERHVLWAPRGRVARLPLPPSRALAPAEEFAQTDAKDEPRRVMARRPERHGRLRRSFLGA